MIKSISKKQKYILNARIPKLLQKRFYFSSSQSIRMSGKSIKFTDNKKSDFYNNKNTEIFNVDDTDVNKILVSKKGQ